MGLESLHGSAEPKQSGTNVNHQGWDGSLFLFWEKGVENKIINEFLEYLIWSVTKIAIIIAH